MCQNGSVHSALIDEINGLACQIIQTIQIYRLLADRKLLSRSVDIDNGLKHYTGTVLNELTHGMQIGGQIHACGEQPLVVLTFALTEQLLPPLTYIVNSGLIVRQDLDTLALAQ